MLVLTCVSSNMADGNQQKHLHRRMGRGSEGGCSPPQVFGQLRFFGQQEKVWAKPGFKDVSMFFYCYFEEINSLYFILTKILTSA